MIKRIVLTGGPGSGKTTVTQRVKKIFMEEGYRVIIVDETASFLINMGICPFGDDALDMVDFQEIVLKAQLAKEAIIDRSLDLMDDRNTIIIYDRGALDNRAYVNPEEFQEVLMRLNNVPTISQLMNKYDLVINLVSRSDFYSIKNNAARTEDVNTAMVLGDKTLSSWMGHNNIKIVLPKDHIEEKVAEVINIINRTLDEKSIRKQEKFLVKLDDLDFSLSHSYKEIEQIYLESNDNIEKRIRKSIFNGATTYTYTVYRRDLEGNKILESEEEIDERDYNRLIDFKDEERDSICKTRYYFTENGKYFYVDKFLDNDNIGVLEINVLEGEEVYLPSFITIIDRVSGDEEYSNKTLAYKKHCKSKTNQLHL